MRQQFLLPEADREFLHASGMVWETIVEGGSQWLLLHAFNLPPGYNQQQVTVALQILPGYPDVQLDMVWFSPALHRLDGRPIGALSGQDIDGKPYQRWSRHRTPQNPWRPGDDDLSTHLLLVTHWLERELLRG
ncbi:MAG: hypothetical protein JNM09_00020 [Blastocatellia bacterium]|nr:hypothetical protein [Blastocatellia bacterium]